MQPKYKPITPLKYLQNVAFLLGIILYICLIFYPHENIIVKASSANGCYHNTAVGLRLVEKRENGNGNSI